MTVALIDYGAGNLHSVHNALKAAGAQGVMVTADAEVVRRAQKIVLISPVGMTTAQLFWRRKSSSRVVISRISERTSESSTAS